MKHLYMIAFTLFVLLIAVPAAYTQTDSDQDGLPDTRDHCPNQAGPIDNDGCPVLSIAPAPTRMPTAMPVIDSDMDSVPDVEDLCPQSAGYPEWNGCPDTDGDGLTTQYDNCPDDFGSRENLGCPVVIEPTATPQIIALPLLPEDDCYVATLTTTPVNIRETASTNRAPSGVLDPYQPQRATGLSDGWVLLEAGGYVSESVIRLSDHCDAHFAGSNDIDDLEVVTIDDIGDDNDYKCVYFTALFRNTGDEDNILLIRLPDAIGNGSSNHIGPALVPVGETYFAEKHFLVPASWEVPDHPEAGWDIIYDEFATDLFDFSLIDTVNFLVTFREDCSSPQPVCYYVPITVNNPNDSTINAYFFLSLVSGDNETTEWIFNLEGGDLFQSYPVSPGQSTHNLYVLSPWHYDTGEHLNLSLAPDALFPFGLASNTLPLEIVDAPDVEIIPIESINHLCDINPVEISSVGEDMADDFAPAPDTNACYYFEQEFLNLTDDTITSPEYQFVVYYRNSTQQIFDLYNDTFSTSIFSNGDKLQHLQSAPHYALEFGPYSELFISYRQFTPLPAGLVEANPTLFMVVDDSYCESGTMPFTHNELFEEIDYACYRVQLNYENNTDMTVDITVQLQNVINVNGIELSVPYGEEKTKSWEASESRGQLFSFLDQPPDNGYLSYTIEGPDDLVDAGTFSLTYNCALAQ